MLKFKEFITESKNVTIDVDWTPDSRKEAGLIQNAKDSLGVTIKPQGSDTALVSGNSKDIIKILKHKAYFGMSDEDIKDLYPELFK